MAKKQKKQEPTAAQFSQSPSMTELLSELIRQVERGKVTRDQLEKFLREDVALEQVVTHAPPRVPPRYTCDELKEIWNRIDPEKGNQFVEFFLSFCSEDLSFRLTPPSSDFLEKARRAIFWRKISGVSVLMYSSLRNDLGEALWPKIEGRISQNRWLGLQMDLNNYLLGWARLILGIEVIFKPEDIFGTIALFAAAYIEMGESAENFRTLLDLCRSGNFPLGFDTEGRLIVLCAD